MDVTLESLQEQKEWFLTVSDKQLKRQFSNSSREEHLKQIDKFISILSSPLDYNELELISFYRDLDWAGRVLIRTSVRDYSKAFIKVKTAFSNEF